MIISVKGAKITEYKNIKKFSILNSSIVKIDDTSISRVAE